MTATAWSCSRLWSRPSWWLASLALFSLAPRSRAQSVSATPLVTLTSENEERQRLEQIIGKTSAAGFLLRSASSLTPWRDTSRAPSAGFIAPEMRAIHNSALPFSLNDGPLWAGRGWNASVLAGGYAKIGPVRAIFAPTFVSEQNLDFQVIPFPQNAPSPRNVWANPFHPLPESIDLPLRFGDRSRQRLDAGQSSLTIDFDRFSVGAATENRWWGPGIRNAITLSNNAAGFPHLFLQTQGPIHTWAGAFNAQLVLGKLGESDFFDSDSTNDTRSLSGLALTWTAPFDSGLTLGAARIAMTARGNNRIPLGAFFDVFRTAGHANADTAAIIRQGRDQIFTLFGRWVFPTAGFEAYGEWARFEEPLSLRDLMEFPGHSQGYTLGFQWATPVSSGIRTFRLQGEASYLEPDPSLRVRNVASSYTSRGVPQGFTNRGKTLGAAIGPGASSQWLAGDLFAQHWRLGAYLERIRWDNGTMFLPIVPQFRRQDVTLLGGLRGSYTYKGTTLAVDFAHAARFYYLFQAYVQGPIKVGGIDILNNTVSLTLSRAVWPTK